MRQANTVRNTVDVDVNHHLLCRFQAHDSLPILPHTDRHFPDVSLSEAYPHHLPGDRGRDPHDGEDTIVVEFGLESGSSPDRFL